GGPLTWSLPQHPDGMSIDSSGVIRWPNPVPPTPPTNPIPVTIQVCNRTDCASGSSARLTYNLFVIPRPPRPPVITSDPVRPPRPRPTALTPDPVRPAVLATPPVPYRYQVVATNPDNPTVPLNYFLSTTPMTTMTIDSTGLVNWDIPVAGTYNVAIRVCTANP